MRVLRANSTYLVPELFIIRESLVISLVVSSHDHSVGPLKRLNICDDLLLGVPLVTGDKAKPSLWL